MIATSWGCDTLKMVSVQANEFQAEVDYSSGICSEVLLLLGVRNSVISL